MSIEKWYFKMPSGKKAHCVYSFGTPNLAAVCGIAVEESAQWLEADPQDNDGNKCQRCLAVLGPATPLEPAPLPELLTEAVREPKLYESHYTDWDAKEQIVAVRKDDLITVRNIVRRVGSEAGELSPLMKEILTVVVRYLNQLLAGEEE